MLTLTYVGATTIPLEAEAIRPDQLAGKSNAEIERLPVQHGNASVPLGEFFRVAGDANDDDVLVEGACSRVKWMGAGMTRGRLTVRGPAGMHTGAEMEGGELVIHGNASDWLGAEMRGGRIHVHGNAGHCVGGAYRGSRFGMKGGVILVDGNVENEVGGTMRRGLIAVGGNAGDFAAVSMIAGSVFIFGQPGIRPAAGMKRGTLALFGSADSVQLLPSFRFDCVYRPQFLPIYLKQLSAWGLPIASHVLRGRVRRYSGDLVAIGKGEVLQLVNDAEA